MSDIKVNLPLHVRADYILKAVAKCSGEPYTEKVFSSDAHKPWDAARPSSPANPWFVEFEQLRHGGGLGIRQIDGVSPLTFGHLQFSDAAGHAHSWGFFQETNQETSKQLCMSQSAFPLAVARRLVALFGGEIELSDTALSGVRQQDCCIAPENALFPPRLPTQSDDDRWYQWQNVLQACPVLSPEEIMEASQTAGRFLEPERKLHRFLACERQALALDAASPIAQHPPRRISL